MKSIFRMKSLKISILSMIACFTVILPFSNTTLAAKQSVDGLEKPTSNVESDEFDSILKEVKGTETYKSLAEDTNIDSLEKSDIVINKVENDSETETAASVGFIIGEDVKNDDLAYVEIAYNLSDEKVEFDKEMYASPNEDGTANLKMVVNDEEVFSMNLNDEGEIIDEDGQIISQEEFYNSAVEDLDDGEISTQGWCEWVVGALCGAGGGAACWGAAAALGITTGVGGVSLATVCSTIGSLGCTGATKAIC